MATKRTSKDEPPPEYYTVKEAAILLRVTEATLFRLINTRKIASRKLGGRRLIPRTAIEMPKER